MDLVKINDGRIIVAEEFTKEYAKFQKQALAMELKCKEVKEALKHAMEERGIYEPLEDDYIKITYRKATTRTTVDSKKLKEELPDIYEEYSKTSNVASSISIEAK